MDEGWVWSLSFDNDITSWGFALDHRQADDSQPAEIIWENILKKYPSLKKIAQSAAMASKPGRLIKTGRLQRKAEYCFGDGWVAMPHSVGFVDPLYSTGFAFSLAGIEKIAEAFALHFTDETNLYRVFEEYQKAVFNELRVIDLLVAGSYRAMSDFRLFTAWSMVYFTLTIKYEQLRLRKLPVGQLFCANDDRLIRLAEETYAELTELTDRPSVSEEAAEAFTNKVRERIRPYNTAGLLDPAARNMYRHTVAKL